LAVAAVLRKGAALAPDGRAWRASRTRSGSAAGRAVDVARKAAKARRGLVEHVGVGVGDERWVVGSGWWMRLRMKMF